jgi:hypothetical protein
MPIQHDAQKLMSELYSNKLHVRVYGIGSYHAFGDGKDVDYVVGIVDDADKQDLLDLGFVETSPDADPELESGTAGDHFFTMRRDDVNLIVTKDPQFFDDSIKAFHVVKKLALTSKADRIAVHQIVVDGLTP